MAVFVLDRNGRPLMPCTQKRARLLLERGRARIHKMLPFTIRIVDLKAENCAFQALRIKLDPGSKTTGIALVRETTGKGVAVLNLFELLHRGRQISESLTARRGHRRQRRSKLRYRAPRFNNRGNQSNGWLAPSLQHRVDTTLAWVKRIENLAPISAISTELVRFDMQALENPQIEGAREYLLEKWHRTCAYCDAKDIPLQIEHIHPKAQGGSNRISNLTLACPSCNAKKAALPIEVFLARKPERLKRIQAQARRPLKDAAAVNSTRLALINVLKATGLAIETASGSQTKFNRSQFGIPKTHALDAACVGAVGSITDWNKPTLCIKAMGRGSYQRTRLDKFGCVRGYLTRSKNIQGFQTGDMVRATVTKGKKTGSYTGRVAVRASGNFNIQTSHGLVQGISHRYCTVVQRGDGYGYSQVTKTDATGVLPRVTTALQSALYLPGMNAGVSRAFG